MDPNEALKSAREAVQQVIHPVSGDREHSTYEDDTERLAESFNALDDWLSKGGFLPDDWKMASRFGLRRRG